MTTASDEIQKLFTEYSNEPVQSIDKLPQSGGDRIYFRIQTANKSFIAAYSTNLPENQTFIYFTDHFRKTGAPLPEIYALNAERTAYLQEDLGTVSLLDTLEKLGQTDEVKELYKKTLHSLAQLQVNGDKGLDYDRCITSKEFGKQAILSDLLYFKYYFLDTLKTPYDKEKLGNDLDALSDYLSAADHKYFMFRDFQSRNVVVKGDEVFFIDYQGRHERRLAI